MKRSKASLSGFGIEAAKVESMKLLPPGARPKPENPDQQTTQISERPLKICVVFDEAANSRSAEVLIRHVASDYHCDTQSFHFDELDQPAPGVAAAQCAADTDIFVLAVRGDRMLPAHIQSWLGLCLGLRDEDLEGALVALIPEAAETTDLRLSLVGYLETVATIAGLAFFARQDGFPHAFSPDSGPACPMPTAPAGFERF